MSNNVDFDADYERALEQARTEESNILSAELMVAGREPVALVGGKEPNRLLIEKGLHTPSGVSASGKVISGSFEKAQLSGARRPEGPGPRTEASRKGQEDRNDIMRLHKIRARTHDKI